VTLGRLAFAGICIVALVVGAVAGRSSGFDQDGRFAVGPDSVVQPPLDGCARDRNAIVAREVPNWVYVGDKDVPSTAPPPVGGTRVTGIVDSKYDRDRAAAPAGIDDPVTHTSYDFTFNVKVDPQFSSLLASGNFEGRETETERLHTERETGTFPAFAWPDRGDRVDVVGSWVWDCDHTGPAGERTEIHPFHTLWLERNPGGPSRRSAVGDREADLFFTTAGTPADTHAICAHGTRGNRAAFKRCVLTPVPRVSPRMEALPSFTHVLRAPPKPSRRAHLVYRVVDHGSTDPISVRRLSNGVRVSFDFPRARATTTTIAKQIFVGWRPVRPRSRPVHLQVRLRELLVRRAMDPGCAALPCPAQNESTRLGQNTAAPGEWNVYVSVGGVWSAWRPILIHPTDGQRIKTRRSFDLYVPRGKPWRLFVMTRECDFGLGNAYSPQGNVAPCPRLEDEVGSLIGDDVPGIVADHFRSPQASLGIHRSNSRLRGSTCPSSNRKGCYRLTYEVSAVKRGS